MVRASALPSSIPEMLSGNLCVSLTGETLQDVFASDVSGVDCVEVRLDYLKNPQESLTARWDRFPVPVIATCRGKERGGLFDGSIEDEIRILESAARNGARWVDIDYRYARPVPPAEVISSYHNFEETPADLETIVAQIFASNGQIAKIATQVNSWADNRRLLALLDQDNPKPLIVAGMGDIGQITRIVGPARGSFLSYAASNRQAAPGQLSVKEMLETYKFRRIGRATQLIGILGMPVGHSLSPLLHNRAFAASNLDFAYVKLPAPDLQDFAANAKAVGLRGFSVTIPHKVAVMSYLSRITPAATAVGAVNTVSEDNGDWAGDNTDVHGVEAALKSVGFDARGKKVVIMGRGGGAKAAVAAVQGAREVSVLSRADIAEAARTPCDLLVNATPVGMYPNVEASPLEGNIPAEVVFDMVYNPATTALLRQAAAQNKKTVSGTAMFLAQAARQFEIWTGQPAPAEVYATL
jgi:3-dehydroquinate dehydratase/shikimate dehydrogenase